MAHEEFAERLLHRRFGQYAVTGGFWGLPTAVQIPGAPLLSIIASSPGRVSISWSPNTPGFVLQESLNLSTTNWLNAVSGGINPVNVPAVPPAKFYRLFKPYQVASGGAFAGSECR